MTQNHSHMQKEQVVRLIRLMAVVFALAAVFVFFDLLGLASQFGLTEGGLNKILGGVLLVVAAVDIFVIPRVLLASSERK